MACRDGSAQGTRGTDPHDPAGVLGIQTWGSPSICCGAGGNGGWRRGWPCALGRGRFAGGRIFAFAVGMELSCAERPGSLAQP